MIVPVILAGGSGNRLWPLSREHYPKQLLNLVGQHSLLQTTILRTQELDSVAPPLVICNQHYRFIIAEQLRQINVEPSNIILEPVGRGTAPAIAIAAMHAMQTDDDPTLLVLPADHLLNDTDVFSRAVLAACEQAQNNNLVTFGIAPTRPDTGFGYIHVGEELSKETAYRVAEFVEKPGKETAESYLASGDYYWNSGMFLFKASVYLNELEKFAPQIAAVCREAFEASQRDLYFTLLDKASFSACEDDSIDYAVMEPTDNAVVVPMSAGWHDIGSWTALWEVAEANQDGNVLIGDVLTENVSNSYVRSHDRLIAAVGLDDHIVIETADAVLVAKKHQSGDIKKIVKQLKSVKRKEAQLHRKVYRPWGFYESVAEGSDFQVKKITVYPGGKLSLQKHNHRAEHWVVVSGTASVIRDEEELVLQPNTSVYIPIGTKHRLWNESTVPLEVIEVQTGDYLGEDDIVRFEDIYARV